MLTDDNVAAEEVHTVADVVVTKLEPPRISPGTVTRSRLIRRMGRFDDGKATFLVAPAGYGKTTLLLQLSQACGEPLVWYQLDKHDNDPAVFLQYLAAGFRRVLCGFNIEVPSKGSMDQPSSVRSVTAAILRELAAHLHGEMLLVIDGYESITDPRVHSLTEELIDLLPYDVHVLIASRTPPPLPLSRHILAGQALLLNAQDLRFSREEIQALLGQRNLSLSEERICEFERVTGGWPAAMVLASTMEECVASHCAATVAEQQADSTVARMRQMIDSYLESEILSRQPSHVQGFLVSTSVFDTLIPEDCDRLLNRTDSGDILEFLADHQLFVVPVPGEGRCYRYHDLFREFLLGKLEGGRVPVLKRASSIAMESGVKGRAVDFLLAAGLQDDAAQIIRDAGRVELEVGGWQTLERWLKSLDAGRVEADPWLSLYRARIEVESGHIDDAKVWISRSKKGFIDLEDAEGLRENALVYARVLRYSGRYLKSCRLLDQVRVSSDRHKVGHRFDLALEHAASLFMAGRPQDAEAMLVDALIQGEAGTNRSAVAHISEALGILRYLGGQYLEAVRLFKRSANALREEVLPSCFAQGFLSRIYADWGQLDRAFDHASRVAQMAAEKGLVDALPYAYNHLASVLAERGDLSRAEECFKKALVYDADVFVRSLNRVGLARCIALGGRISEAALEAESALHDLSQQSLPYAYCSTIAASVLAHLAEYEKARPMLEDAIRIMESCNHSGPVICDAYGILAGVLFAENEPKSACEFSRKHLELAAQMGYIQNLLASSPHLYGPVLKEGIEAGIEVSLVQRILARSGQSWFPLVAELAAHPAPEVRRRSITPLAEIKGSRAFKIMEELLGDPDPSVRHAASAVTASQAIAAAGPPKVETPPLTLLVMGPFRVFCYGQEITAGQWRSTKARDLLAYLAQINEPVAASRILDDLWPDAERDKAATSLHSTFYRLRQALAASANASYAPPREFILHGGKRYHLAPDSYVTDRDRFEELVLRVAGASNMSGEVIECLEEMVDLYRGDYLIDLDYAWVMPEQERLRQMCHNARLRLARFYLEEKQYSKAVEHARALLQMNPLFEEVCCLLMKAYGALDDRRAVQEQYRALAEAMAEELAIAPSRRTRELLYRLCGDVEAQLRQELAGFPELPETPEG